MHYKIKSFIQNIISKLPSKISYKTYFFIQRKFGNLREIKPYSSLIRGYKIIQIIKNIGGNHKRKKFIEIGTGRAPILPLCLYLHDAGEITTVDLNPYLSHYVWEQSILWISKNKEFLKKNLPFINTQKLDFISEIKIKEYELHNFLSKIGIKYLAPCDATNLPFDENYFDFHISSNVFEHIPKEKLVGILKESQRILSNSGTLIHGIDYSDHFSHSDHNISPIHFLRFGEKEFYSLAGNRYMYMNRLRDDDFQELFNSFNFNTVLKDKNINKEIIHLLEKKDPSVKLHNHFLNKENKCIANLHTWYALKLNKDFN